MFNLISMRNPRRVLGVLLLLVIGVLVLSGCAPRPEVGSVAAQSADPAALVIDLPPLGIDVDDEGAVSIGDVPLAPRLAALHAAMRPSAEMQAMHDQMTAQLAALAVPASWVDFFQRSNIQYLQLNTYRGGLLVLVNGEPLPSLAWDAESLQATAETLALFGVPAPTALEKLLPLAQNLGMGVMVRFPPRAGEAALPLYGQGDSHGAAEMLKTQAEFLEVVGSPPRIHIPVVYARDGSFSMDRLSDGEWTDLTGIPWSQMHLDPTLLDRLSRAGVERIQLSSGPKGIQVAINGMALPWLAWADGELAHLLGISEQMALGEIWAPGTDREAVITLVRALLPVVQSTEFDLTVDLPQPVGPAVAALR
jgi:hypothetical protein